MTNNSEAYRHHCELVAICNMPTPAAQRAHLDLVEKHRGLAARQQLEQAARAMWAAVQSKADKTAT